ncbi:hypothetical protein Aab01nite_80970 [Paractinoplanes abujensis]|uniref:Redox-sensitive bicupin YhaK (Pirin superfamily) n=1 Tax=Paractinoplanes abujensis TaxID=882441 RepID=A0A7W7CUN6_9ACTN|nr:pirin-like C-terminal cupin domain-containing protein [Actinoplanes abujensis]MBB4693306.1 redox-sensitive bicupin YhaK (pirin superfamily) [Actinoplanes abujensis]GID24507.1 hypothetical protein Aab01nite_80970 [Actinoplanes abujensis]
MTLEPNRTLRHALPAHDRAFFAVLRGSAAVAGRTLTAGQTGWSDPLPGGGPEASTISLRTGDGDQPAVVLAFSGKPIRQSVVFGGPFVMNTEAEIVQAHQDFRSGRFGAIPRQARLQYR